MDGWMDNDIRQDTTCMWTGARKSCHVIMCTWRASPVICIAVPVPLCPVSCVLSRFVVCLCAVPDVTLVPVFVTVHLYSTAGARRSLICAATRSSIEITVSYTTGANSTCVWWGEERRADTEWARADECNRTSPYKEKRRKATKDDNKTKRTRRDISNTYHAATAAPRHATRCVSFFCVLCYMILFPSKEECCIM